MIKSIFVPLESLEAEEDNEPPSLDSGHDLLAYSFFLMFFPSFSLTSKPKLIRKNPFFSGHDLSGIMRLGFCCFICICGSVGEVLTFFPWCPFFGQPRC